MLGAIAEGESPTRDRHLPGLTWSMLMMNATPQHRLGLFIISILNILFIYWFSEQGFSVCGLIWPPAHRDPSTSSFFPKSTVICLLLA